MSKTPEQKSHRLGAHGKHFRLKFLFTHIAVMLVIASIITAWLLTAATSLAFNDKAYNVQGKPSISAHFINHVLQHYHSPAAGKGQALFDDSLKYHIDPVYALAFFMHESTFGTRGVATVTHSLGNIRATAGYQSFEGFRLYPTWEAGFEDWYKLISKQYIAQWHLSTINQIIPRYAPSSDHNNVAAYIQAIKKSVQTWRSGLIEA